MLRRTIKALPLFIVYSCTLMAHELPVVIQSKLDSSQRIALENAFNDVSTLLPLKFKEGLPKNIQVKIQNLSSVKEIPIDICKRKETVGPAEDSEFPGEEEKHPPEKHFVYGVYKLRNNTLYLDSALLKEFQKGRSATQLIECQHRSLYDQSIASIIHELAHAYDFNNHLQSQSSDFFERLDFKRGIFNLKNKNIKPMRSADPYEIKNEIEAYAVNMEYFLMDPEFACRRPSVFNYYKSRFDIDPFPNRKCQSSNLVMMSTSSGLFPMELDVKRIYRIDYLMASPGNELSSGFGHSMFRIVMCAPERFDFITKKIIPATVFGEKCLEDKLFHLVVSYRANVEGATLNYIKGIFGGYPSMLFILSLGDVLDEYNKDELRDVVAYPMSLTVSEREELVNKILEEHWNYQGSYKFITNNCAVESYDLLRNALDRSNLQKYSSLTPKGVLQDLDKLNLISLDKNEQEKFPAQTESLLQSLKYAYQYKGKESKKNIEYLKKFIDQSQITDRQLAFDHYVENKRHSFDKHDELVILKGNLLVSSSFSVMEQQILKKKSLDFRKKMSDALFNDKGHKANIIKKALEEMGKSILFNGNSLARFSYGVPLKEELNGQQEIESKIKMTEDERKNLEEMIKGYMPKETRDLDKINANIHRFNDESDATRKEFRAKLEVYIDQSFRDLSSSERGKKYLVAALNSSEGMRTLRERLDINLVSTKEILDVKLAKIIRAILSEKVSF